MQSKTSIIKRQNKFLNPQILTKTEVALEAINRHESNQPLYKLPYDRLNHIYSQYNPINILTQLNQDSYLTQPKQLKFQKDYKLQLFPYSQQFYYFKMQGYQFPIRVILKNVKNQFQMYVGYNKQYPGYLKTVESINNNNWEEINKPKEQNNKQKNYDQKFTINKEMMILLKKKKKLVNQIHLSFVASDAYIMSTLKIESIRLQTQSIQRSLTEGNINSKSFQNELFGRQRTKTQDFSSLLQKLPNIKTFQIPKLQSNKNIQRSSLTNLKKNYIKLNTFKLTKYKKQINIQKKIDKKIQEKSKIQIVKINKQAYDRAKQKQRQLKQVASKFKRMIGEYQQIYKAEYQKKKKIIKLITPIIYISIFINQSQKNSNIYTKRLNQAYKIKYLVKKFIKKLRRKYYSGTKQIPNKNKRILMNVFDIVKGVAKISTIDCYSQATKIIWSSFNQLLPGLSINHTLGLSAEYRRKVRLIQRSWLSKYRARIVMLQVFARGHVTKMLQQFPHLKVVHPEYQFNKIYNKLIYEYMIDQSLKFRHIYKAYLNRLQQIHEYTMKNQQIIRYNELHKNNHKIKKKQYLLIPNKPNKPQHRFFRNLDILRSMIRGWFELKYKQWIKKNNDI